MLQLDGLSYINSAGLGIIAWANRQLKEKKLGLAAVPAKIERLVSLLGIKEQLCIADSVDAVIGQMYAS